MHGAGLRLCAFFIGRRLVLKKITFPVTWEVCGFVTIEAPDIASAIAYFNENSDHIPLPLKHDYVDGSFTLTDADPAFIELYNAGG